VEPAYTLRGGATEILRGVIAREWGFKVTLSAGHAGRLGCRSSGSGPGRTCEPVR